MASEKPEGVPIQALANFLTCWFVLRERAPLLYNSLIVEDPSFSSLVFGWLLPLTPLFPTYLQFFFLISDSSIQFSASVELTLAETESAVNTVKHT
ncbi:hypothetical protein HanIR_Chr12g0579931 [Helianthus annuus]|nr:hypothetical protein HanIR_Chr12g0579931 [Helianthus annuus]